MLITIREHKCFFSPLGQMRIENLYIKKNRRPIYSNDVVVWNKRQSQHRNLCKIYTRIRSWARRVYVLLILFVFQLIPSAKNWNKTIFICCVCVNLVFEHEKIVRKLSKHSAVTQESAAIDTYLYLFFVLRKRSSCQFHPSRIRAFVGVAWQLFLLLFVSSAPEIDRI